MRPPPDYDTIGGRHYRQLLFRGPRLRLAIMFKRSRLVAAIGLLLLLASGCASRVATGAAPSTSETAPHEGADS